MKPRTSSDSKIINKRKCERKHCKREAYAIILTLYLCELHFRHMKPIREKHFRYGNKFSLTIR